MANLPAVFVGKKGVKIWNANSFYFAKFSPLPGPLIRLSLFYYLWLTVVFRKKKQKKSAKQKNLHNICAQTHSVKVSITKPNLYIRNFGISECGEKVGALILHQRLLVCLLAWCEMKWEKHRINHYGKKSIMAHRVQMIKCGQWDGCLMVVTVMFSWHATRIIHLILWNSMVFTLSFCIFSNQFYCFKFWVPIKLAKLAKNGPAING